MSSTKDKEQPDWTFYLPQYWPFWLVIFILRCIILLPLNWQLAMGRGIGKLMLRYAHNAKRIARINLRHCFPELDEPAREALLKKNFDNIGMAIFETGMGFWASDRRLKKLMHIHGQENLEKCHQSDRGTLLIGAHFTSIEITGRMCLNHMPYSVIYRPHKIGFINFLIKKARAKHYPKTIPRNDLRGMIRHLRSGKIIWYSADVNMKGKVSVFAPFFGVQAATITVPTKFTQLTNCHLLPVHQFRHKNNKGYDITFLPEIKGIPSGDPVKDATIINQVVEKAVREAPEQYLWQYMRFKTRPEGEARMYSKRILK